MRNLNINYIFAKNFLCFGPKGIEIKFSDYANLVFVRGENRDSKILEKTLLSDEVKISSNGSGKSSIQEIISYALFGKTIKKPTAITKDGVINNLVGKDCLVDIRWDKYRVVRTRKKNSLRFWESESNDWENAPELTTGSMDDTQSLIENIIGLSYESFISICVFTDDQVSSFLEANAPMKREIVENLLALSIFRDRHDKAKKLVSDTMASIKMLSREYEILRNNEQQSNKRLQQAEQKESEWRSTKSLEIEAINKKIDDLKLKLGKSVNTQDFFAYQNAQQTIVEGNLEIEKLEKTIDDEKSRIDIVREKEIKIRDVASDLKTKNDKIRIDLLSEQRAIDSKNKHIDELKNNEHGATCGTCYGVVDEINVQRVIDSDKSHISAIESVVAELEKQKEQLSVEIADINEKQKKVKDFIASKEQTIVQLSQNVKSWKLKISEAMKIKEPRPDNSEILIQQEISQANDSLKARQSELEGSSPFEDIISSEKQDVEQSYNTCIDKSNSIKSCEDNLKYYHFWQSGFGDKGIRKSVVDGIIPQLNNRISYWLQFLIDNKIVLKFDNEFNETIERNPPDGDSYIYHAMSAGQRRRLNLAVSQAFADIMMISCGTAPSIVFLDEVTTNIDPIGVQGIYNMIQELCQEKQVFVTTHDKDLIKMLETATTLNLIHDGGFTTLEK